MAKEITKRESNLPANPGQSFRKKIQAILMDNEEKLMNSLAKLPPKDFCDAYIRLLPFGFSRVPEEKAVAVDENAKAILARERTIQIIKGEGRFDDAEEID